MSYIILVLMFFVYHMAMNKYNLIPNREINEWSFSTPHPWLNTPDKIFVLFFFFFLIFGI